MTIFTRGFLPPESKQVFEITIDGSLIPDVCSYFSGRKRNVCRLPALQAAMLAWESQVLSDLWL